MIRFSSEPQPYKVEDWTIKTPGIKVNLPLVLKAADCCLVVCSFPLCERINDLTEKEIPAFLRQKERVSKVTQIGFLA